jgi:hypothetical protein
MRRRTYQRERSRSQRDGGIGLVTYRLERRRAAYRNRFKGYNIHKTFARALVGRPRRKRK